jgi:hypothetical protein
MDAYMSSKLGISTAISEVFKQTAISTDRVPAAFVAEHGPVLAVGTGLALKDLINDERKAAA